MRYERTGNTLHDDLAALMGDLQTQMVNSEWRMMLADALHGYLTAVSIGPHAVMPSAWLPGIFFRDDERPEFKNEKQAQNVMHAVLNVYNGVLQTIQVGSFSPFISWTEGDGGEEIDLSLWCRGFLLGTSVFDEAEWDMLNDSDLAEICLPIFFNSKTERLPEIYASEQLKRMETLRAESGDLIIDAVYDIRDYFKDTQGAAQSVPEERAEPKTGRNDPCPCGSGKKYKKCCGGLV